MLVTKMVKVTDGDVSAPPFAVPPSSWAATVTDALPFAFAAGVKVSVPSGAIDGCTLKSALLLLVAAKVTLCDDSLAGPGLMLVAHGAEEGPESSFTVTSPPLVNDGGSLTGAMVMVAVLSFVPPLPSSA